jgi:hypothetical protein
MHYDFIAIPDGDVPQAVDPTFQHALQPYASETNKTVSVWRAVPDALLDFKPHEKTNPIRTILVHQLLSERRFFAQRRVLHTCHHRTQVQTWLRLAGPEPVPAIYGPSGNVKCDEADPTYSVEAARRGG